MAINELDTAMPLLSIQAWGLWKGQWIFQRRRGRTYVRTASVYDLSPKAHLLPYQPKFAGAVAAWQGLSLAQKRFYTGQASKRGLRISGYNHFISLYLRDKI